MTLYFIEGGRVKFHTTLWYNFHSTIRINAYITRNEGRN
jgi:hypothetical protein